MSKTSKILKSLSIITAAASMTIASTQMAHAGKKKDMEKCYGIVKAGKNDCASSNGSHSCAAAAKKDSLSTEWLLVPKGTCDKIANGSTTGSK